jgi:hypothetical protein
MARLMFAGLLTDKITIENRLKASPQHDLDLDINVGLVAAPTWPIRPLKLRGD